MKKIIADFLRRVADYLDPPKREQAKENDGLKPGQIMTQDGPFPPAV